PRRGGWYQHHGGSRMTAVPRVGVIGAGQWGKNLARNFRDLGALAAVCDTDEARLRPFREGEPRPALYLAPAEALANAALDAVAVATPAETHGALVREALLAGKDVFVEKPLCLSVEEGRALVAL